MNVPNLKSLRVRLTLWYVIMLATILLVYVAAVFFFQYAQLQRQMYHDEVQDVETVEGLLVFNPHGDFEFKQNYFARPQNRQLVDRYMEVLDPSGAILYESPTLKGQRLGDAPFAEEGTDSFSERSVRLADGTRVFMISHVHPLAGHLLLIRLGYSLAPLTNKMRQFFLLLLFALPVALVAATFAGYFIAQRALAPLDAMALRAETITASDLSERLTVVDESDELGHMARVLNHLLERLERAFAEMKRFTADAAHELRTPLAALRGTGELALEHTRDSVARESISNMLEETIRLNQTIDGLLLLAKTESQQIGDTSQTIVLPELVREVLEVLGVVIEERRLTVTEKGADDIRSPIRAERSFLRIALLNVLHNAVKFSPPGSTVRIVYSCEVNGVYAVERVCVKDAGPGITEGEHDKVLERFFTSRNPDTAQQSGAGLGLSIAKLAVERSGGKLFFDPATHSGACCCIELPTNV